MRLCIVANSATESFGGGFISTNTLEHALEKRGYEIETVQSPEEISNPDIILHQNIKYLVQTQRICEKKNLPLIVTVNGFISCCTGTHVINKTKYGVSCHKCTPWGAFNCFLKDRRNKYPSMTERVFNTLTTIPRFILLKERMNALNRSNRVICISATGKKMLQIAGVGGNIEVIPQPVSSSFLIDPEIRLFDEKLVLFTGGISWIKGAHLAAEAVSKLDGVKLVLVGKGYEKIKRCIVKKLGDDALFCGVVNNKQIKNYYYSAHVVLFPSIWFEAFGRGWAEACMCGKPVVVFNDRGGASDYLKHEETALLSDYDVDAYAEQIQRLFDDDALYRRISRNAQEYAKKNFLADVVAKKYEKVFEEVLEK
ncbi:MAG: hypothetical protein DRP85_08440 [Candidatus Makaraimicrobium thalassicum]|nr:MAG: hypothetical protein DRP85_08440 [Candidatus Omnitrophota bacterium]